MAGEEREHAEPVGRDRVELLDRPLVPRRVARGLQLGIADGKAERERSVDHGRRQAVAVEVLEPQLGRAGAEAVVVNARAPDRAELLGDVAARRDPAAADDAVFAHPRRVPVVGDDARTSLGQRARQPRLPDLRRYRVEVEVIVAGVHGVGHGLAHFSALGALAIKLLIERGGAPAVVPPSTGNTMPVICAARSLARNSAASATSRGDPTRCSGCIAFTISPWSRFALIAVGMCAGAMQFTRTPWPASSTATDRVTWVTAAFVAR